MAVHESFLFHITSDKFIIEPRVDGVNELLVIDRVTQEISLTANDGQIPASALTKTIYGIFGIIRLVAGPYLIVITKKIKVGEIDNHSIWQVVDTEMHSYKRTFFHLNEGQQVHNRTYVSMTEHVLKTEHFYFSTTFDLSHTLQRLSNTSPDFQSLALHERADQRFVWNGHILRELAQQPELGKYCLPIILGCIFIKSGSVNNKLFDYILVSRRCIYRAGTRFYMRGVDDEGQVANFVETEQIVQYNGNKCSFVQTRGSIPLFWSQRPNLKRIPVPIIYSTKSHVEGFKRHFDDQVYNYGKQVVINLVNQKGYEHLLEKAFAQTVLNAQNEHVRYEAFDFHKECSQLRWDRLSLLINRLQEERKQFGYFFVQKDGHVVSQQLGVFRTNCMDCLDRTNVVQGMLAKEVLQEQLARFGVMESEQTITDGSVFDLIYKNVWADHADVISKQYAGTGALKTDFTRTGKRTGLGLIMDGLNSAVRYFKNNFQDGFRQDAIDLFLGNHIVEETEGVSEPSPLKVERDWKYYAVPVIFLVAMAMFVISILLPDEHFTENLMYILFWGTASAITLAVIVTYGQEFVDQPRLAQAKVKMD
ncbi:phosphatidylinositol-3-phosphatase SAC1-like [Gigantopelta aegis]|uniref:phosphatidylinositol-3-phosphatase SAC1-like n=1 Tax=Gigantopelta aegis TaxID=1735272 RepID=UPI001B887FD8|nr:phosphatidylinositol-3-phosphatase SAC1-like [Gigantopelta aegis]